MIWFIFWIVFVILANIYLWKKMCKLFDEE